jgi:hypothetical protein
MHVIYKGNSKRLLKNHTYKVERLYNDGSNPNYLEGKLEIKDLGLFYVSTFTDLNKKEISKINYGKPLEKRKTTEFSSLKKGDILVCKVRDLKSIVYDRLYIIEDLFTTEKEVTQISYGTNAPIKRKLKSDYVSLKGIKRNIIYSPWKFEKIPTELQRDMNISSLLGISSNLNITTEVPIRKIDFSDDKEKDLIELIAKSVLDRSRHHYGIMDWIYCQIGKHLSVNKNDYEELLDMKLSDILKIID